MDAKECLIIVVGYTRRDNAARYLKQLSRGLPGNTSPSDMMDEDDPIVLFQLYWAMSAPQ